MDLIRREDAIKVINDLPDCPPLFNGFSGKCDKESLINAINAINGAIMAHWISMYAGGGSYICSNCEGYSMYKKKYCPNCGAKMDEDLENNIMHEEEWEKKGV